MLGSHQRIRDQKISAITDPEILDLFRDLERLGRVDLRQYGEVTVYQLLLQSIYPLGGETKHFRIQKKDVDCIDPLDASILRKNVGKAGNELHRLLGELAVDRGGVEMNEGKKIHVFLSDALIMRNKPSATRYG